MLSALKNPTSRRQSGSTNDAEAAGTRKLWHCGDLPSPRKPHLGALWPYLGLRVFIETQQIARKKASMALRISRRFCPAAHSTTCMASPAVPFNQLRSNSRSFFIWPISASITLRRRSCLRTNRLTVLGPDPDTPTVYRFFLGEGVDPTLGLVVLQQKPELSNQVWFHTIAEPREDDDVAGLNRFPDRLVVPIICAHHTDPGWYWLIGFTTRPVDGTDLSPVRGLISSKSGAISRMRC